MPKKLDIEEMRKIAKTRGGVCLSDNYINSQTKLRWRCKKGHEWEATPSNIKRRKWCPFCAGKARLTIEEMQKIAETNGGACISDKYKNSGTKLRWRCKEGHEWAAIPDSVKRGGWCPVCANRIPLTIDEMRKIAESRGGACLSDRYKNINTKLRWRCKEGHVWDAAPSCIKSGTWCPICAGRFRLTIEEMKQIAASRGGECLSNVYVNARTKLHWRCEDGHEWEAVPDTIKGSGSWCPVCSARVTERICRGLFKYIFEEEFPCKKPAWLRNSAGYKLELDGYSEKLGMAFEYNGPQHYESNSFFHQSRTLDRQIERDKLKNQLCKKQGIRLIEIPYTVKHEDLFDYIVNTCKQQGIQVPAKEKIDYRLLDAYSPHRLHELQVLAESKGGMCLSKNYIDAKTKLRWRCKEGHEWVAIPDNIKSGNWCPVCSIRIGASKICLSIKEIQKIAESRGGICLSDKYIGKKTKLRWRCKNGHEWEATPSKVKRGSWCPFCAGRGQTIADMQKIAESRGGICLSNNYTTCFTKLRWRCNKGHEWEAVPNSVKRGSWCPVCTNHVPLTLKEMRKIAESRGGACLSDKYTDNQTKLRWQCKEGHEWGAAPNNVKNKTWCPVCSGNTRLTLEKMRNIAESRGGVCLSDTYVNSGTKLTWRCKNGHKWDAIPKTILRGTWCPYCAKARRRA